MSWKQLYGLVEIESRWLEIVSDIGFCAKIRGWKQLSIAVFCDFHFTFLPATAWLKFTVEKAREWLTEYLIEMTWN